MLFPNHVADIIEFFRRGFDQEQPFVAGFHLTLPTVNRVNVRDDIRARSQLMLHKMPRNLYSFSFGTAGTEDDSLVGHIKSPVDIL